MADPHVILGVGKNASKEEIKKAYRLKMKKVHPDLNHSKNALEETKEINAAYELLKNDSFDDINSNKTAVNNDPKEKLKKDINSFSELTTSEKEKYCYLINFASYFEAVLIKDEAEKTNNTRKSINPFKQAIITKIKSLVYLNDFFKNKYIDMAINVYTKEALNQILNKALNEDRFEEKILGALETINNLPFISFEAKNGYIERIQNSKSSLELCEILKEAIHENNIKDKTILKISNLTYLTDADKEGCIKNLIDNLHSIVESQFILDMLLQAEDSSAKSFIDEKHKTSELYNSSSLNDSLKEKYQKDVLTLEVNDLDLLKSYERFLTVLELINITYDDDLENSLVFLNRTAVNNDDKNLAVLIKEYTLIRIDTPERELISTEFENGPHKVKKI